MIRFLTLLRQQKGTATIEFAFASLFFFGIVLVGLDFGVYAQQQLKLGNAVEQAAVIAFNARAGQPTVNTSQLNTYITSVVGGAPTVTFQCNGVGTCDGSTPASRCISAPSATGAWPTFTAPTGTGTGATCSSDGSPGYYVVIRAVKTYRSVAVPDKYLNGGSMQQQAVVRLS